jgi:hypothetical protein
MPVAHVRNGLFASCNRRPAASGLPRLADISRYCPGRKRAARGRAYLRLRRAAARVIVVRGRWSAGLAQIYRVSDRTISEQYRDLVQRRVSRAWPPRLPSIQSVTYLVKYAWPEIALFYAMARLANDVRLARGRLVTPDFAAHARGLLAPPGQPHKIYDGEP